MLIVLLAISAAVRLWAAWPNPGPKRFWDERYLVANTARALTDGWTSPQNVYYPGLGHFPTFVLLEAASRTGIAERDELAPTRRELGAAGYRTARVVTVAWSVLGLLFVFLLGRELGGPALGLLAAGLVGVVPWHLRQSILYKPDIVLTSLLAGAAWATVKLARVGGARWFVGAWGLGALALSAKLNAAPMVLPLALASLRRWRLDGRAALRPFAVALAAGGVAILLLNPPVLLDPGAYPRDLAKTAQHYEGRAERAEASRLDMPLHALTSLASEDFFGLFWALLAAAGLGLALRPSPRRGDWGLVVAFPLAYVALYSSLTAYPSPHNWLPLVPFVAVLASRAGLELARRAWRSGNATLATVAALLLAAALGERAHDSTRLAHREAVPTTAQVAERVLEERLGGPGALDGRVVVSELPLHDRLRGFATQGRTLDPRSPRVLVVLAERDDWTRSARLADARLWRRGAADASDCDGATVIDGAWWRSRGPDLCLEVRPWERGAESAWRVLAEELGGQPVTLVLPANELAEWVGGGSAGTSSGDSDAFSYEVAIGRSEGMPPVLQLVAAGGQELDCEPLRTTRRRIVCRTRRQQALTDLEVRLVGARHLSLRVLRWTRQ